MLEIKQTKYKSVILTTGLTIGLHVSRELELDNTYDVCDGIQITEISNGGIANGQYNIGVRNTAGEIIEPIPVQAVATTKNDGTNPNERFVDVLFDTRSGNKVKLEADLPAAPGTPVIVIATFRQRKTMKPVSFQ